MKKYFRDRDDVFDEWRKHGFCYPLPQFPSIPDEFRGMTCGAKTRAGTPCKRRDLYVNLRCKFHGGLSTGPRTASGKTRSAQNGKLPKRKRTP